MKKLFIALLLVSAAAHAEQGWRRVGQSIPGDGSPSFNYDLKEGSCSRFVNANGVHVMMCMERIQNTRTNSSTFDWIGVDQKECQQGWGTLWTMDFNGVVLNQAQVASGGGTIGAGEWDFLCRLAAGTIT